MKPANATIIDVIDETPSVRSFVFDLSLEFTPGQYIMVWVRGVDEVPMSLSDHNMITVQQVGDATSALFELAAGDTVGIRGPYGRGFDITNPVLIVAGGVGAAPLAPLAEAAHGMGYDVLTLLGARMRDELLFQRRFEDAGEVMVATDDGSAGFHGRVTDLLDRGMADRCIRSCGPEPMMYALLSMLDAQQRGNAQFSLHRYIKCGLGICGACCIDPSGECACVDGPVFRGSELAGSEFGRYRRGADGVRISIA
uniref:Sulfhydrogenase 1 subunit gamma n=1 Tax=Candidatus Methanogaster sp. ANME-2c ERB4 TaxID=2759911 RepID=A0A7G9YLY1_9EURY|nr:sulfhydrogenase 1 subunit gamma [Methanosarcinales archaeon ANME-2c ERB4]